MEACCQKYEVEGTIKGFAVEGHRDRKTLRITASGSSSSRPTSRTGLGIIKGKAVVTHPGQQHQQIACIGTTRRDRDWRPRQVHETAVLEHHRADCHIAHRRRYGPRTQRRHEHRRTRRCRLARIELGRLLHRLLRRIEADHQILAVATDDRCPELSTRARGHLQLKHTSGAIEGDAGQPGVRQRQALRA